MGDDALSQILKALRLRGSVYFHTNLSAPWGIKVPSHGNVARFHMAIRGSCWLRVDDVEQPIRLAPGDIAVIPHGAAHVLSDRREGNATALDEVLYQTGYAGSGELVFGGEGDEEACKLLCGHFEFDDSLRHPLLGSLPSYMHLADTRTVNGYWLEAVMRFVSSEIVEDKPGADAIVDRLTEIVFIQVLRSYVDNAGDSAGCLAGILDPKLGRSLSQIHRDPSRPWTVETMAQEAGMSRTVFAERFTGLMGMTPLNYVTSWRMHLARRDIVDTQNPLIEIAEQVGYSSEASFNRAFKRQFNVTPGEMRRSAHRPLQQVTSGAAG
ncbi:helix-turn-helix domain-containing protein [Stappia sp. GBMRC 2046]|uniref:Helix-turn-helix domain-containing protein n=1 Tax=Stappia sediminis TaxID=2692190 RepID=A0A7X3LRJ8_9HYPH|nr:AraC family transcriptional regulator [Stappia sediminis]MXN63792.1 helix-turn-helix domain-containing protein [Stappia sediminis]